MPVINDIPLAPPEPVPPTSQLCGWTVETSCVPDWNTYSPALQDLATQWASETLWALTGRRFGGCPVVYRPCNPKCQGARGYIAYPVQNGALAGGVGPWMVPFIAGGTWRNCVCPGPCSCAASCQIPFPTPVVEVTEVKVDGAVVTPTAYRLDVDRGVTYLVRTDGACWPECQNMDLAPSEVGTMAVTYTPGEPLPLAGSVAAGKLAGEFLKQCSGAACALPDQLISLSRNGVDVQVADPQAVLDAGLTGHEDVDLWIRSVNPARLAQRSRVYSPDTPQGRFTR